MNQNSDKKRLIVAGAFIVHNNKVLLSMRNNSSTDNNTYGLIGGKVEHGEPIHAALIREIYEEVGIIVKPEDMQIMHILSFCRETGDEIISCDFMITKWSGEPFNKEPLKHAHIAWFELDNLPNNILSRHKDAYFLFKKGIYYSSLGYK